MFAKRQMLGTLFARVKICDREEKSLNLVIRIKYELNNAMTSLAEATNFQNFKQYKCKFKELTLNLLCHPCLIDLPVNYECNRNPSGCRRGGREGENSLILKAT